MNVLPPTRENLAIVAEELKKGNLAILPTETVYGLAADAKNEGSVSRIFQLKGRPANNPLIVHLSSFEQLPQFVAEVPDSVHLLHEAFMPGPLTLVLPKSPKVSSLVTGGLDTVAIRMPDHAACLGVMELGELALAMPSANPFMQLSPTNISMIDPDLADGVFACIDGGACTVGIESTVLDLTGAPTILRLGTVTKENIESVLQMQIGEGGRDQKSPGMYKRHYAPRTSCCISSNVSPAEAGLVFVEPSNSNQIQMPAEPRAYAQALYASLAEMDTKDVEIFFIQSPPKTPDWAAVWDRLTKATA